ncbi:uncharacterized protein PAC_15136 [Phialocephala subalpina]|uniref:Uncharacterized protein n=1 Tax=Phialocephala subalpina TaxID=576137 RepID=A0A1L7XJW9_9HELO|nr:uncharacterized protein PAC_15136 [Phialocephala subalpina]
MSHHAPQTCIDIECNYESSEADAYLRHYLRDHSNLCPYTCTHCKDIFISEEELKAHICRKQPKIDESYQHRISMALKALPPLPTRDKIVQWIFDNIPPPPKDQQQEHCYREGIYQCLGKNKGFLEENGCWMEIAAKVQSRVPIQALVSVTFCNAKFEALSANRIYESILRIYPEAAQKASKTVIGGINEHLKNSGRFRRVGKSVEEKTKSGHFPKGKDLWSVEKSQRRNVKLQAKAFINQETDHQETDTDHQETDTDHQETDTDHQETDTDHYDSERTNSQLVVLALKDGPKTLDNMYQWISRKQLLSRAQIARAARSLKLERQGDLYVLRDGIKLSRKRCLSAPTSKAKRIRTNIIQGIYPTFLVTNTISCSPQPCADDMYIGSEIDNPQEEDPEENDLEQNDSHEDNPKDTDPGLLIGGIGTLIQPGDQGQQAKEMHQRLVLLHKASFYYGSGGAGLEEIRNKFVSDGFVHELVYNIHVEEKWARERADMGDGFTAIAHICGGILSNIHELLFSKTLLKPLPPPESTISFEADEKNTRALFLAKDACFSCLTQHAQSKSCPPLPKPCPPLPKPVYPSPRHSYSYYDLLSLLPWEHGSSLTSAQPTYTVYCWLRHHRRRPATDREITDAILRYCETVGKDEKGDDLLCLKSANTAFSATARTKGQNTSPQIPRISSATRTEGQDTSPQVPTVARIEKQDTPRTSSAARTEGQNTEMTVPSGLSLVQSSTESMPNSISLAEQSVSLQISVPTPTLHSQDLMQPSTSNSCFRSTNRADTYVDLPQAHGDSPAAETVKLTIKHPNRPDTTIEIEKMHQMAQLSEAYFKKIGRDSGSFDFFSTCIKPERTIESLNLQDGDMLYAFEQTHDGLSPAQRKPNSIVVSIKDNLDRETVFTMLPKTKMQLAMRHFCQQWTKSRWNVDFYTPNGQKVLGEDTPEELGIKDGDTVEARIRTASVTTTSVTPAPDKTRIPRGRVSRSKVMN